MDPSAFVLVPENEVRACIRERPLFWRLLRPPYAALGVGKLRVLRLRERDGGTELLAGYERYERIGGDERRSKAFAKR